jgi:hypothetical protein
MLLDEPKRKAVVQQLLAAAHTEGVMGEFKPYFELLAQK